MSTSTIRVLLDEQKPEMEKTKAQYKELKNKEKEAQESLLKSLEPRNKKTMECAQSCAK